MGLLKIINIQISHSLGGSRIFEGGEGGGILGLDLQAKKSKEGEGEGGGGPCRRGPTLGSMLTSLHRGPKRGVRTTWTPLNPPGCHRLIRHRSRDSRPIAILSI